MRSFVITLIVLVAVVAGALATAPWLVDWNDYRAALIRQAEAITGGAVAIEGRISFRLLPGPTLTLARTKLARGDAAAGRMALVVDRLDLRLRVLPLLRGQVQVGDIRLVRPILQLDTEPDPDAQPPPDHGDPVLSLLAIRPDHLAVVDGRVQLRGDEDATWQLDAVNLQAVAENPDGPFTLDGSFAIDTQRFAFDARVGRVSPDAFSTLQLGLAAGESASLRFRGAAWWDLEAPRLRGEMTLAGDDARSSVALVGGALRRAMPRMPPWLDQPFEVTADVRLGRDRLQLDALQVGVAGLQANGEMSVALGADPAVTLALRAQELMLSDPLRAQPGDLAFLTGLPAALRGEIDLSVAALHYRDRTASRVRIQLALAGDGEVAVRQASAILPGQTDVRFEGVLAGAGEDVALEGDVNAVTDDLNALLAWLELEPANVPGGRLRTLSLASRLALTRDELRFSQAELRVDATQLRGSLNLATGSTASRARVAADVVLDRLNVDDYRADLRPADAAQMLQRALRHADADIEARIERLSWRGVYMRNLVVALRAEDGRVVLNDASIEMAGEADARLEGEMDLESGAFTWSGELHSTRPVRLLRRLRISAPLTLTRMSALTIEATAAGTLEAFELDAEADDGAGLLTATGEAGWVNGDPRFDLEVGLNHPDYGALFRSLGARTPAPDADPAPLSVTGKVIRKAAAEHTIVGSARIDAMTLTGLLAWQQAAPRPAFKVQLSVGDPSRDTVTGLLSLAGLDPSPALFDASMPGNWPRGALSLGWLSRLDGELSLSAKGGLAGEGVELEARLQDQELSIERCMVDFGHGTADVRMTLDAGRPLPFLSAALDLRQVDAAWLATRIDLEPVIEGAVDVSSELTAAGASPYDLVRSMLGRIDVSIGEGRLVGDPMTRVAQVLSEESGADGADALPETEIRPGVAFHDLVGSFSLDRGMAAARSVELEIDGAEAAVSGMVDLFLWAADLNLEIEPRRGDPIELRIIGPLQRPQTRLDMPQADARAAPSSPIP